MSEDSKHYEIKNELSRGNDKLGSIDKQSCEVNRNVDLLTEWAVAVGVAIVALTMINLIMMVTLIIIASKIG